MGALLWVQVPSRVDHNERSEAQLHEGDRVWGGSVERSCGPMNKNRIEGVADQGERANSRKALVILLWVRGSRETHGAPRKANRRQQRVEAHSTNAEWRATRQRVSGSRLHGGPRKGESSHLC